MNLDTLPSPIPIDTIRIERGIAADAKVLLEGCTIGKNFAVVSDVNTHAALAAFIEQQLPSCTSIVLPAGIKPTLQNAEALQEQLTTCDAAVAVGSGTINDLCKYASFRENKPYVVFGTAPSMNGYTSANVSLIIDGFRTSRMAHLPKAVFLDTDILSAAPKHLIQSGLGDALCRPTAQADWLLSHLLLGTAYNPEVFAMLMPYESPLFEQAGGLMHGDFAVIELLATTLVLSGLGMTLCGGSYPASQGEHMIAHTMEMLHGASLPTTYHGQEIGVTTLTMARLQEQCLSRDVLRFAPVNSSVIVPYFGALAEDCLSAYQQKLAFMGNVEELQERCANQWDNIRQKIHAITLPTTTLEATLQAVGAPTTPTMLGWPEDAYAAAVHHARYSRDRFTFLDIT